jgi:hypothetical protein
MDSQKKNMFSTALTGPGENKTCPHTSSSSITMAGKWMTKIHKKTF